jgi:hypothetical protein
MLSMAMAKRFIMVTTCSLPKGFRIQSVSDRYSKYCFDDTIWGPSSSFLFPKRIATTTNSVGDGPIQMHKILLPKNDRILRQKILIAHFVSQWNPFSSPNDYMNQLIQSLKKQRSEKLILQDIMNQFMLVKAQTMDGIFVISPFHWNKTFAFSLESAKETPTVTEIFAPLLLQAKKEQLFSSEAAFEWYEHFCKSNEGKPFAVRLFCPNDMDISSRNHPEMIQKIINCRNPIEMQWIPIVLPL